MVKVVGTVSLRPEGNANADLPTGEIEVVTEALEVLSVSAPLPFPIDEHVEVGEEARLRHRYLDMRRDEMQRNLRTRARVNRAIRAAMDAQDFVEVETPSPSPFARSLLFGYVAQFMYEGDSPLAERRAQALSLDPSESWCHLVAGQVAMYARDLDAAEVHHKKALALKTDCNGRYVYLDPRVGGRIAVAECARRVTEKCVLKPLAEVCDDDRARRVCAHGALPESPPA